MHSIYFSSFALLYAVVILIKLEVAAVARIYGDLIVNWAHWSPRMLNLL